MTSAEHFKDRLQNSSGSDSATTMYDLVCIGFGPAQIATAIANRESKTPSNILFLERKPAFSWHSGVHGSRTRMDNPFMYDLATLRNPRSAFSYVNYLLARKRLIEFANSDRLTPLRVEFEDYLRWCAEHFKGQVRYETEAREVAPVLEDNVVSGWKISVKDADGGTSTIQARSIVAPSPASNSSAKQQPLASVDFLAGQRIISMDDYQSRRNELRGANEPRLNIAVVGSSPQTIEVLDDLLSCPRLGNITVVTENDSLAPLRVLGEQEPPQPRLCSIWAKPSCGQETPITEASELLQTIYMRAYEKQVTSRGQYSLRIVIGKDAAEGCAGANFIIRDAATSPLPNTELLRSLEPLVLGCRSKGDSLEEVQFKRSVAAGNCRVFLVSANSEGGRTLAKDVALMAGHIAKSTSAADQGRRDGVLVQARI